MQNFQWPWKENNQCHMLGVTTISLCTIDIFGKFALKKGGGSIFTRTDLN